MLPSLPEEDTGRGSPYSRGGSGFVDFCLGLGFNALLLGPQGQTAADNPSPYDGAIFSRSPAALSLLALTEAEQGELLTLDEVKALILSHSRPRKAGEGGPEVERTDHLTAEAVTGRALAIAFERFRLQDTRARREMAKALSAFRSQASAW